MYKEIWKKVFSSDGNLNRKAFEHFVKVSPPKRFGRIVGTMEKFSLKPGKTLMLLVGPSGCGKSTFATSFRNKAQVVSIDALNALYIRELNQKEMENFPKQMSVSTMGEKIRKAEQMVLDNLESIILNAKEKSNLVILDACLIDLGFRTVVLKAFENFFDHVVLVFFDVPLRNLIEVDMARTKEFGNIFVASRGQILEEWRVCQALKEELEILALGVDEVYFEVRNK